MTPGADAPTAHARHGFHAVLREIENRHRHLPRVGRAERPCDEAVRLGQSPSLAFAPSALAGVWHGAPGRPCIVRVRFFGLWGPQGPMPLLLSEQARERALRRPADRATCRFADVFHHRLLSLLYRAWAEAEPAVGADRSLVADGGTLPDDPFGRRLAALAAPPPFDGTAGASVSAEDIERGLSRALATPVRVRPWRVRWIDVPGGERCRLGAGDATARLGGGALVGACVRDGSTALRLEIGPVSTDRWRRLLSTPDGLRDWLHLLRRAVPPHLAIDWRLRVTRGPRDACRLESSSPETALGRSTWLGCPGDRVDGPRGWL